MITVKASQKLFTHAEPELTPDNCGTDATGGICSRAARTGPKNVGGKKA